MSTAPHHAGRAHALLTASGAERWLNCPPSARLTEHAPRKDTTFTREGEAAHEYAEMLLRRQLFPLQKTVRNAMDKSITDFQAGNAYYNADMEHYVGEYVGRVGERFVEAVKRGGHELYLEQRLDYSAWAPEGFGTGDVVLLSDGLLDVIDLKYGKGKPVDARNNAQGRLYALGVYQEHNWLHDIRRVRITIDQPRRDSVTTEELSIEELLEWGESFVKPRAALAWEGKGDLTPGDHCQFCPVKATCRARRDANMAVIAHGLQDPRLLTWDEIGGLLHIAPELARWANDLQEVAQEHVAAGGAVPGWKLVAGTSRRTISDAKAAIAALQEAKIPEDKFFKPRELQGIGALEKAIGKKDLAKHIGSFIVKPVGKPTLVPEDDPRESYSDTREAFTSLDLEAD